MEQTEMRVGRGRSAAIKVMLWLGMLVTLFAVAEGVLAVYTPFELTVRGDRIVLPANREYVIENDTVNKLDRVIVHRKNSLGFRGDEPPAQFDQHLTIVTVGGSTTECFYLSDGKTWPDRLAVALPETFSAVWLNNAGLDGHSTFGHSVLMQDHIAQLRPKVALFLIGINDVHAEGPRDADWRVQRAGIDLRSPKKALTSVANYSAVFASALNVYRHVRANLLGLQYDPDFDLANTGSRRVSETVRGERQERYRANLPAFGQRLNGLVDIARRNGIEPVLITQPALYGQGIDDVTAVNLETVQVRDINGELAWDILEMYNEVTRDVGAREGLLVIDLAAKLPKSSRYFYDFHHSTNEGAARIAEIVHESLCPFLASEFPEFVRGSCGAAVTESASQSRLDEYTLASSAGFRAH